VRREWREHGFFTGFDDTSGEIRLVGSRAGLSRFAAWLRDYVRDPGHADVSDAGDADTAALALDAVARLPFGNGQFR